MRPLSLVSLEPRARLTFPRSSPEKVSQTLKLVNASAGPRVAWKVRTAAPQSFLVAPRSGVLEGPGDTAEAVVTLLPGQGEGGDFRFEVQATALDGDVRVVSREDWRDIPRSSIQATEIRAILTAPPQLAARPDVRSGAVASAAEGPVDGGNADMGDCDSFAPEYAGGEQSLWRRPAAAASSAARRDADRSGDRATEPRWQPDGPREARSATSRSASGADGGPAKAPLSTEAEVPPPQMSTATKAVLGGLIALLALHLYVWPVVSAFMAVAPEEPPGQPPAL